MLQELLLHSEQRTDNITKIKTRILSFTEQIPKRCGRIFKKKISDI